MSRFLITCWPFVGHLYPQISIAHALRSRGHEVAFYTHASTRPVVEGEGFTLFPFVHVDDQRYERIHVLESQVPASQPKRKTLSVAMKAYRDMLADSIPEQVADLQPILASWRPDALITDLALWGPILVLSETCGIPVALSSTMMGSLIPGPDAPPWGPGLPPPRTFGTRLLANTTKVAVDLIAHGMRRQVNGIRARYGLGPMGCSINEFTGRLPLYLIPSLPELDYNRHDQPSHVHYIGPCVWTKSVGAPTPDWLNKLPSGRPWVHATEGTAQYQVPFLLRATAQALASQPVEVILTTGQNRNPEELGLTPLPANVHVERWLSHDTLLPRCAAIVTTGGPATVLAALKAGVPLLMVPTFWEKSDNAQRVVEAGVGLRLAPRHCTPDRVRAAVMRLLNEPHFRENARRIAQLLAAAPGPARAAELLEQLVQRMPASRPADSVSRLSMGMAL
jgi:MGT family glycosyltransferase